MKISTPWLVAGTLGGIFLGKFIFSFPGPRLAADAVSAKLDAVFSGADAGAGAAIDDELDAINSDSAIRLPTVQVRL